MRISVRSLGGKLIISAALTLLLCMLLFVATSWYLLKFFYEREARSDAAAHLTFIKESYETQSSLLIQALSEEASDPHLTTIVSQSLTPASAALFARPHRLSTLEFISNDRKVTGAPGDPLDGKVITPGEMPLVDQGLREKIVTALQLTSGAQNAASAPSSSWNLEIAIPVQNKGGGQAGILLGAQRIDDLFANDLVFNTGWNVVLCQGKHVLGTSVRSILLDQYVTEDTLCATDRANIIDVGQHYLTLAGDARAKDQLPNSPSLVIVDVEPLYTISTHPERAIEILLGMGAFVIALGVTIYALVARTFFIRPIRRLQARVTALVEDHGSMAVSASTIDELSTLARSFNLLSESLHTRENESNVITKQMGDLLTMSDILISTLNLEHLLGEIVSRIGSIMQVKSVSLLLYGREMLSPWAVAQWSDAQANGNANGHLPTGNLPRSPWQYGAVTVHTDPDGDITLAVTSKLAAIPAPSPRSISPSSGKRRAIRAPKLTPSPQPYGLRHPRIPRPALRDLDMILARMAMQKQKIAYAEDVAAIYQERRETWARMALEAGYRSVIAVPLLLQEQPIGAFVLYNDRPDQVTGSDTFLLSTAAIQAAMAIQNALLFVEVKDKNAALERVNHLKSQFLATVTHELRTPLHSIISYGALILEGFVEGELTTEQEEHIQFIVRRAEDLSHLVDDMLDLSKIEADRLEVKVEPMSLAPGLTEVMNQLKPMANSKSLYLSLEMEDALPLVLADDHRLRQIVINLVSNALKFTEQGGVTIRCTLLERYDMLRISVTDTGIGISPAALEYIFEAFRQADGSTTRRFGGTGLGLTIARKLIELQGGEVTVESIVGQGSTFSFTLPIAPPARVRP